MWIGHRSGEKIRLCGYSVWKDGEWIMMYYGEIVPLPNNVFKTGVRREINGIIKVIKLDKRFEKVFDICSVILFWLLVASAYD